MAWMVSLVLIMFYVMGKYAFHDTTFSKFLPYAAGAVIIIDYIFGRWLRKMDATRRTD
jgi:hypothetical protein